MSDNSIIPIFKVMPIEDKGRTAEEGRPIFRDVEHVEIHISGDNKSVVVHKVNQSHI